MTTMTREELEPILTANRRWNEGWPDGVQANLTDADLSGLFYPSIDLRRAIMEGVNLSGANICGAALQGADLSFANLRDTNLEHAVTEGTDFSGADLRGAKLKGTTILTRADMTYAMVDDTTAMRVAQIVTRLNYSESSEAVKTVADGLGTAVRSVVAGQESVTI